MKLKNKVLELTKNEVIEIVKNNPDKTSVELDKKLIKTICIYYNKFSIKQLKWLTFKINYIVRHCELYKNYRTMKDILLLPENNI